MTTIPELLDRKRRNLPHTEAEIRQLVTALMSGDLPDYQLAAWLMAVCIHGLSMEETTWLTDAYVRSGTVLDLSGVAGVVVDKHSTGGVGDKTTLVLIPLLAACGLKVAKLSGRGLGFTGGTIDKLEAIPGFQVALSQEALKRQIAEIGVAISSQTEDLAPADAKTYALRDVTATVSSIPLIAASVVSKKIAAGADVIVLDIKVGHGAFMQHMAEARALAETCREVGRRLGKKLHTVISGMHQPLGYAIGHSMEVLEAVCLLQGRQQPADLLEVCLTLGAVCLVSGGLAKNDAEARLQMTNALQNGSALEKFKALIRAQGGNADWMTPEADCNTMARALPYPKAIRNVTCKQSGFVTALDPLMVAQAAKLLGAGRQVKTDPIDLSVGVLLHKKVGDAVQPGDLLAELHTGSKPCEEAETLLADAFSIGTSRVTPMPLIDAID
ncbi:MAG: thymidine phosphorylase [Candidatus Melainabacteria bacterium]